ncbi:RNA-binding protein [Pseudarthrobacter sp. NamB4]|uniref:RNA-binding protein n=1 Tax=Pseudarthrobacter sp. NamB4 TaxID=2576837 RepID=UPI0010FE8E56|nr:RNA-binding protein [Pseudarthrobacter sp. NamB4]TLM74490.1 RNA-binding protein [Pseudarthrobacter sp. NamB4]
MGLNIPQDLDQWRNWQRNRHPLRKLRAMMRPSPDPTFVVAVRGDAPAVLVALDADTPTQRMSLLEPLKALREKPAAVLAPAGLSGLGQILPGGPWAQVSVQGAELPEQLRQLSVVLAVGHYLPAGALAHAWSRQLDVPFDVVQHGLLTPHAPPLAGHAHLLAFSGADADFWRSGRNDVTAAVVGSQLLWHGQQQPAGDVAREERPLFLGQLHGAELPRTALARAAGEFCAATGAVYRPHPSETDQLSRLQHGLWQRRGIKVDRSRDALATRSSPVVSVFSTGVLEAAARGVPAWVTYPSPPAWLEEFWERYGMSPWGTEPTPGPAGTGLEPAKAIARVIEHQLGGQA